MDPNQRTSDPVDFYLLTDESEYQPGHSDTTLSHHHTEHPEHLILKELFAKTRSGCNLDKSGEISLKTKSPLRLEP